MKAQSIISLIKEKLTLSKKPFLDKGFLDKLRLSLSSSYTIEQLISLGVIQTIRRGELYKNNQYSDYISPQSVIGIYAKDSDYMIGGLYVYNQYGFTTQVAQSYTVYSNKLNEERIIGGVRIQFKQARPSFFRGRVRKKSQGIYYYVMSPERALIQLLDDTDGIIEFEDDIRTSKYVDKDKLIELSHKHCSKRVQHLVYQFLQGGITKI